VLGRESRKKNEEGEGGGDFFISATHWERPEHLPAGGKVEQVRATFSAEQSHLPCGQKPCSDSDEQAMYGLEVSYEMPVPVFFEIS
jgi:hypothetical protein